MIYAVPAVYGLAAHQYGIAAIQALTTCGSTLFHWARETRYFNLDNIGAMSLLFTTAWGFGLAIQYRIWYYVAFVAVSDSSSGVVAVVGILRKSVRCQTQASMRHANCVQLQC